jgi:hypothetical protein
MASRAARFAVGALTCIVTGAATITMHLGNAVAAGDCLAAPNKESPVHQHWYYRVDRITKRHCWYLGDQGKSVSHAAKSTSSRRALLARLRRDNPLPVHDADARAEVAQRPVGDTLRAEDAQLTTQANQGRPVEAQSTTQDLPSPGIGDDAQSLVAARWPDPADAAVAERQATFAVAVIRQDTSPRMTTDAVPGTSPVSIDKANMPTAGNVDMPTVKHANSVYSLFWAICGALVLVSFAGGATYFMTGARGTHEGWSPEPFDLAQSTSWLDQAKEISAQFTAADRCADVPRQGQAAGRLAT